MTFESVGGAVKLGRTLVPERAVWRHDGYDGSPSVRVEFELRDGQPVCVGVQFEANSDGRGVLTGDLNTLPSLNRLAVEVFAELSSGMVAEGDDSALEGMDVASQIRAKIDRQFGAKADRKADIRTDAELQEVAKVYRENVHEHPRRAVEVAFGMSSRTASRRIEQARARGYLPATTQGRKNA